MRPKRIAEVLERLIDQHWPAFIWGPPGVGKSAIVKELAMLKGLELIDVRSSLLDPTDLRGIPAIIDNKAVWCPPSFLPSDPKSSGILFLDEINAAPPLVQASLYQLVLDRRIGEYVLPKNWWIVAAGNRSTDKSVVFRLASALANRFMHIDFDVSLEDWKSWAVSKRIHPTVVGFLSLRPELLLEQVGDSPAYATPRTWEMASDVIHRFGSAAESVDLLMGTVGEGPAAELLAYEKTKFRADKFEKIVAKPKTEKLPKDLSEVYALTAWLAYRAGEREIRQAAAVLLERLPAEFAVIVARDMIKGSMSFMKEPGYKEFVKSHGELFV